MTKKKILLIFKDMGGSADFMQWKVDGIVHTLRANIGGHPPIVVLRNGNDEQSYPCGDGSPDPQVRSR